MRVAFLYRKSAKKKKARVGVLFRVVQVFFYE